VLAEATRQLRAYFSGDLRRFDLPLAAEGTIFQQRVWRKLGEIPFATTWSYGALARAVTRPTAYRAVGAANGRNPISIIIPCHRVIGSDGSLTGYGGGEPAKRWLLDHEARVNGGLVAAGRGVGERLEAAR
jgi:methylated-DNA-[protein]-cysteine S-methyltransferase